ncbi:glycoprotein-N-acetylgalactosamine 3-beta-galactosyltransferase 1-like isoform X2 [Palaemon carinicauda]|uniref:glycoprotein-N-acetylgalactosamine 3-beta-galactosyltransferase 1-like isoform X2 n=1 Tax=Palaemon carinicauda TaxID=392227 RepID=UPI0035B61BC4
MVDIKGDGYKVSFWCLCLLCIIGSTILLSDSLFPDLNTSFRNSLQNISPEGITLSFEREKEDKNNGSSLLCWVLAHKKKTESTLAVNNTWGKRCDKLIFFGDVNYTGLNSVELNGTIENNKSFLWGKTRESLKYLYDHYINEFQWFYKADVDTYAIVENLRYILTPYDPEFPIALGQRALARGRNKDYFAGGAGYVLSKGALKIYGEVTYHDGGICTKRPKGSEDVTLGRCLKKSGILFGDTRDELGRHRFYQYLPQDHIKGDKLDFYNVRFLYKYDKGIDSLSETTATFHRLKDPSLLYALEFFIYKLQLFGVEGRFKGPNTALLPPDTDAVPYEVLKRFGVPRVNKSRH